MRKLFILCLFFAACSPVETRAATYYIDNTATGSNNGTSWANAWTSFAGAGGCGPGDIVYISGGANGQTYKAQQFPVSPRGGVQGNPVVFKAGQDAGHNGMITVDGTGGPTQWIFAAATKPMKWITIDGNYQGQCHIQVLNWGAMCTLDSGATGVVFRYLKVMSQIRAYDCDYMEYDHLTVGPTMGIDRCIVGLGKGDTHSYLTNSIHDCNLLVYYQHGSNSIGGNGDDVIGNVQCVHIYHNNFIGVYVDSYTKNQHGDGIQSGYEYIWTDSNYFENIPNYPIFVAFETGGASGEGHHITMNNVINFADGVLTKQPSQGIAWGCKQATQLHDILIANNTVFGGGIGIANNITVNTFARVYIANNLCYKQGSGSGFTLGSNPAGVSMLCNKTDSGMTPPNSQQPVNSNTPIWNNPSGNYPAVNWQSRNFAPAPNDTGATANGTNQFATFDGVDLDQDAQGIQRPAGKWALGALEPGGGPAPTPTPTPNPTPTPTPSPTPTPTPTPVPTPTPTPVPTPTPTPGPSPTPSATPIVIVVPYPSTITIQPRQ